MEKDILKNILNIQNLKRKKKLMLGVSVSDFKMLTELSLQNI